MEKGDLKISENTVVHCATEELANQVLEIADKLGYKWCNGESYIGNNQWDGYISETTYHLHEGRYDNIDNCIENDYRIIEAEDFLKLHEEAVDEIKPNVFVYYRGDERRGAEIIKALQKLGGKVTGHMIIVKGLIYYIELNGYIGCICEEDAKWLIDHCTEAHLPEPEKGEHPKVIFHPFDKVLGRDSDDEEWRADFFSHYKEREDYRFFGTGDIYRYCIPYNDDTKHLLGTTNNYE